MRPHAALLWILGPACAPWTSPEADAEIARLAAIHGSHEHVSFVRVRWGRSAAGRTNWRGIWDHQIYALDGRYRAQNRAMFWGVYDDVWWSWYPRGNRGPARRPPRGREVRVAEPLGGLVWPIDDLDERFAGTDVAREDDRIVLRMRPLTPIPVWVRSEGDVFAHVVELVLTVDPDGRPIRTDRILDTGDRFWTDFHEVRFDDPRIEDADFHPPGVAPAREFWTAWGPHVEGMGLGEHGRPWSPSGMW